MNTDHFIVKMVQLKNQLGMIKKEISECKKGNWQIDLANPIRPLVQSLVKTYSVDGQDDSNLTMTLDSKKKFKIFDCNMKNARIL
jgi:hypothetical protein